jgi:uncharacterized protein YndB with AHSA1/START domain
MSDSRDVVSAERVITAPPDAIFALLADPRRHRDFDGSGSVRDAKDLPDRLRLGSTFGMGMKMVVPYSMVNEVVEFDEGRRIAWQPRMRALAWVSGGRVWRYDLEPVDGGTRVTETWDISKEKSRAFIRSGGKKARRDMEKTLERIEAIVTAPPTNTSTTDDS